MKFNKKFYFRMLFFSFVIFSIMPTKTLAIQNYEVDSFNILRYENNIIIKPILLNSNGLLECRTNIFGDSNTTKIRAELTLEEKTSAGWISLAGWITTEYSSSLSASYTYPRASSGKTYRLTVTADVTTNGRTETVSRSVTASF